MQGKIFQEVRTKVEQNLCFYLALVQGIGNMSEIGRRIQKILEKEGKKYSLRSILTALYQLEREMLGKEGKLAEIFSKIKVIGETSICIVEGVKVEDAIAQISFGERLISIVRADSVPPKTVARHGYGALWVRFPRKYLNVPGIIAGILTALSNFSVNVEEIVSIEENILIIVPEEELSRGISAILYLKNSFDSNASTTEDTER